MKIVRVLAIFACLALPALGQVTTVPGLEVKGPYSSLKKNKDGTQEKFTKTPDEKTVTKQTYGPDGVLRLTTVYRMGANGSPVNCDIFDGQGVKLYKSRYGYSTKEGATFGKLVEEQMLDARIKLTDPDTGKEMPVRRFIYRYNADGSAMPPVALTLVAGKKYEEVYGAGPSGLQFNPFDPNAEDKPKPAPVKKPK